MTDAIRTIPLITIDAVITSGWSSGLVHIVRQRLSFFRQRTDLPVLGALFEEGQVHLRMRRGKEIVQGAHASQLAYQIVRDLGLTDSISRWNGYWGMKKVCVRVNSLVEIEDLYQQCLAAGVPAAKVTDEGLTEFNNVPTVTALGIGPAADEVLDAITGRLTLY